MLIKGDETGACCCQWLAEISISVDTSYPGYLSKYDSEMWSVHHRRQLPRVKPLSTVVDISCCISECNVTEKCCFKYRNFSCSRVETIFISSQLKIYNLSTDAVQLLKCFARIVIELPSSSFIIATEPGQESPITPTYSRPMGAWTMISHPDLGGWSRKILHRNPTKQNYT